MLLSLEMESRQIKASHACAGLDQNSNVHSLKAALSSAVQSRNRVAFSFLMHEVGGVAEAAKRPQRAVGGRDCRGVDTERI